MTHLATYLILSLFTLAGTLCPPVLCPDEPCTRCAPRPREAWVVGLSHFYAEPYIGQTMANGEVYTGRDLTVAIRVDLLPVFPLNSMVRINSACGVVTMTVTDTMPIPANPAHATVVVDVSPAVCAILFCGGCGWTTGGVAYGEELVLVELVR